MTPPDLFEAFVLPFYEEAAQRIRASGKIYVVHMDGRLKPLRDLIARSSIPVIESFSIPDIGGDMTIEEACAAWPEKVILPNFPSVWCEKEDEAIRASLANLLEAVPSDRGIIVQISEDLPSAPWRRAGRLLTEVAPSHSC